MSSCQMEGGEGGPLLSNPNTLRVQIVFAAATHISEIQFITELHLGFALHQKYLKAEKQR